MGFFDKVKDALTSIQRERALRSQQEAAANPEAGVDRAAAERHGTGTQAVAQPGGSGVGPQQGPAQERPAGDHDGQVGTRAYRTCTVQPGDTLAGIAEQHGVDPEEMARLNKLDNPDLIYAGQVFKIPHS